MESEKFLTRLRALTAEENIKCAEPLSAHVTFRIGGPADYYVAPSAMGEIAPILNLCREYQVPAFVMGNGSNLLVGDKGFRGLVLQITRKLSGFQVKKEGKRYYAEAEAGILLCSLAAELAKAGAAGFEFASGIPGTLGGAVFMNAGAYEGDIKAGILKAQVLLKDGSVREFSKEELELGYRSSILQKNGGIVLKAYFSFLEGNAEIIYAKMREYASRRKEKQPLEFPSAGSTFKRPEGYFAGKLIMDAGLRGYRVGDAMVSEKHCGFVVNAGKATAAEVQQLIAEVSDIVFEKAGVRLEPEVRLIGDF